MWLLTGYRASSFFSVATAARIQLGLPIEKFAFGMGLDGGTDHRRLSHLIRCSADISLVTTYQQAQVVMPVSFDSETTAR